MKQKLFLFWLWWVNSRAFVSATLINTLVVVLFLYFQSHHLQWSEESLRALFDIFVFFFPFVFSFIFIVSLLLVFRALFSWKIGTKKLVLYDCEDEEVFQPGLLDVLPLWRKWLFVTVWILVLGWLLLIGSIQLFAPAVLTASYFNMTLMVLSVELMGGLVFVYGLQRCKKIGHIHV
jgi:hypothetical protein